MEVKVLGKVIGTADNWRSNGYSQLTYTGFRAANDFAWFAADDITFDYLEGQFLAYSDAGEIIYTESVFKQLQDKNLLDGPLR